MPITQQHKAFQKRAPEFLKKLDADQKLIDLERQFIKLGQDKRVVRLIDDLASDTQLFAAAKKNPRKVIAGRGLSIPRGCKVALSGGASQKSRVADDHWNIHIGGSAGGHSAEGGYDSDRGWYMDVDGQSAC